MFALLFSSSLGIGCHSFATDDPNVIASGDWSVAVSNEYGAKLRGRPVMCEYPEHRSDISKRADVGIYVHLQEYSDSIGGD